VAGPAPSGREIGRGLAWIGLANTLVGVLDLAAQVIILHLFLSAYEYGVAALAIALFPLLDQATDMGGLAAAVIQRDDHSPDKIATVFWLNVLLSGALFGVLVLTAPLYASWQGHPVVGPMLIVYGGKLLFQNVYFVPQAMMRRELRFKELSIIRMIGIVAEFAGKVGFAATGWKIWCFVLADVLRVLVTAVAVQLRHPYLPRLRFRPREAVGYARFGISTSAGQILYQLYMNADYPVVAKLFGATALGLYRAAFELVLGLVRTLASVFTEVSFPTFARLREKRAQLVEQFIAFTRQNLVAALPMLLVVFIAAEQALSVAWGPDFTSAATAVRVFCVVGVLRALSQIVPSLLDGMGYPSRTLLYHAVAAIALPACFVVSGLLLGPRHGYVSVAVGWVAGYPVAFAVLFGLALRRIGLPVLLYLRRIAGIPACALLAAPFGVAAHVVTAGLAATPRLVIVSAATLAALAVALARLQGIKLWRVVYAWKAKDPD
jgi:polysaccharide transporter, PST family